MLKKLGSVGQKYEPYILPYYGKTMFSQSPKRECEKLSSARSRSSRNNEFMKKHHSHINIHEVDDKNLRVKN